MPKVMPQKEDKPGDTGDQINFKNNLESLLMKGNPNFMRKGTLPKKAEVAVEEEKEKIKVDVFSGEDGVEEQPKVSAPVEVKKKKMTLFNDDDEEDV